MEKDNLLAESRTHHGRSFKRIMDAKGIKIETLESSLQLSKEKILELQKMKKIDEAILEKLAKALDVSVETIKEMQEDKTATSNIVENNTYNVENKDQANIQNISPITRDFENKQNVESYDLDQVAKAYRTLFLGEIKERERLNLRISELEKLLGIQKENEDLKKQNELLQKRMDELEQQEKKNN